MFHTFIVDEKSVEFVVMIKKWHKKMDMCVLKNQFIIPDLVENIACCRYIYIFFRDFISLHQFLLCIFVGVYTRYIYNLY